MTQVTNNKTDVFTEEEEPAVYFGQPFLISDGSKKKKKQKKNQKHDARGALHPPPPLSLSSENPLTF